MFWEYDIAFSDSRAGKVFGIMCSAHLHACFLVLWSETRHIIDTLLFLPLHVSCFCLTGEMKINYCHVIAFCCWGIMFLFWQLEQDKLLTCCAFDVLMYDAFVLATRTRQVIDILLFCIVAVSFYVLLYNRSMHCFSRIHILFYRSPWEYWIYSVPDSRIWHNVRNLRNMIHTKHN